MSPIFFDIETVANEAALALLPEPKAPGNLKDPEKIAAAIAEKKAQQIAEAALDPDIARVDAIAISRSSEPGQASCWLAHVDEKEPSKEIPTGELDQDGKPISLYVPPVYYQEEDLLRWFWEEFKVARGFCVGFNILSFDLPFIMRRSMALGVRPPFVPNLAKFRTDPIRDLYPILYNWQPGKGLKAVAKLYGLFNHLPELDGSQYAKMDNDTRRAYCISDLSLVQQLYNKMSGFYF